nr:scarecrow-like protein 22 isoform X1 [Ipomoea trifida]
MRRKRLRVSSDKWIFCKGNLLWPSRQRRRRIRGSQRWCIELPCGHLAIRRRGSRRSEEMQRIAAKSGDAKLKRDGSFGSNEPISVLDKRRSPSPSTSTSASSSSFGCTAVKDAAAPAAVEEWVVGELQPQLQAT